MVSTFSNREYLESNYVGLKKQNPKFPFLVREALNVQPKVYARYGKHHFVIFLNSVINEMYLFIFFLQIANIKLNYDKALFN